MRSGSAGNLNPANVFPLEHPAISMTSRTMVMRMMRVGASKPLRSGCLLAAATFSCLNLGMATKRGA